MGEIDDFFKEDSENSAEFTMEMNPSNNDNSTFKIRNDTEELLLRIKLHLLNAYKEIVIFVDPDTKEERRQYKIKRVKGTNPICNKQGLAEIEGIIESYVNGHTVQTNYLNKEDFNTDISFICSNIILEIVMNREKWGLTSEAVYSLTSRITDLVSLFLRRGIDNKEREGYSETIKESTHRDLNNNQNNKGFMDNLRNLMGGKK
jgi:hypothetical protein